MQAVSQSVEKPHFHQWHENNSVIISSRSPLRKLLIINPSLDVSKVIRPVKPDSGLREPLLITIAIQQDCLLCFMHHFRIYLHGRFAIYIRHHNFNY